jgi:hypothetical protein
MVLLAFGLGACRTTTERADGPLASPREPAHTFSVEQHRDERKMIDGLESIVIHNPYGEIQVRQTRGAAIAFQANEQRIGDPPRIARFEWVEDAGRQGVLVRYDEHDPETPADPTLGRVDITVFVPIGPRVELRSDFGAVIVRRIGNQVDARSRSGRVVVAARDAMQLYSESGELRAFPMQGGWSRPLVMVTGGGAIADVPLFDGLDLDVRAGEAIVADFPLDRLEQADGGDWSGRLNRAPGGPTMRIQAGGAVNLMGLRQPIP